MNATLTNPPEPETPQAPPKPWTYLDEHAKQLVNHGERIAVLESKQTTFSTAMDRIEASVKALGDKIDKVNGWLLGSVFALCLALLGLIVNLLLKK